MFQRTLRANTSALFEPKLTELCSWRGKRWIKEALNCTQHSGRSSVNYSALGDNLER
jgi:hypothetical protein